MSTSFRPGIDTAPTFSVHYQYEHDGRLVPGWYIYHDYERTGDPDGPFGAWEDAFEHGMRSNGYTMSIHKSTLWDKARDSLPWAWIWLAAFLGAMFGPMVWERWK